MKTGQSRSLIRTRSPPAWSPCSCVIRMPSSEFGSSPSADIRRAVSRALIPASTSTRVPFATSRTELPVEPLPSTEIFISRNDHYKDTKSPLAPGVFVSWWLTPSNFQTLAINREPIQLAQCSQRQCRRGKASLRHSLRVLRRHAFDGPDDFVRRNAPAVNNLLARQRADSRTGRLETQQY